MVNVSAAAARIEARLPDNPGGLPVKIGWDGQRIAVYAGTYAAPAKSLPHVRLMIPPGVQYAEIETLLATAVAQLQVTLPAALQRGSRRAPQRGHHWRSRAAVDHAPGGD